MIRKIEPKSDFPKMEEDILAYWDANDIFKKSVEKAAPKGDFVFYDGPPFATGTPHYGHIVASAIKDAVPRYWTMRGYRVRRKWGWDCHGLPIENIAEKELGIRHKKEIEELGVAKFNEVCRSKVLDYAEEWKRVMHRFGRWADMENAYKTMDRDYMESVWWVFKELWDKGLIYEDYRSMHICPRCETTLSQQEVSEGYKDVKDLSVIAKFELVDEPGTYVLAWTTTPWTLPGNVALAVGKDIEYVKVKVANKNKKVFLISGKHAFASKEYFPKLKIKLEREGYEVTIIDHINPARPILSENLAYLKKFDFSQSHVITHSLGASTFLKLLSEENIPVETLTMIAPSYPGKAVGSTDKKWVEESGYDNMDINIEVAKSRIVGGINIVYSNDEVLSIQNIELLGKEVSASMFREENKKHFFGKEYSLEPDYVFDFNEYYICAKSLAEKVFGDRGYEIVSEFQGSNLVGKSYNPVFSYLKNILTDKKTPRSLKQQGSNESVAPQFAVREDSRSGERSTKIFEGAKEREKFDEDGTAYRIYAADFVTTEDGTGVVHIAPAFGEDDMALGKKYDLPFVQHVGIDGRFNEDVVYHNDNLYDLLTDKQERSDSKWVGIKVKDKDDPQYADIQIIRYLTKENLLFSKEKFEHSYPHCWRCDTPLLNYATSSWFIRVTELKERALELAKNIRWSPEHVKTGRFGKWLEGARDWSISRQRYWASVMPIWKCECGEMRVFGSVAELQEASGRIVDDLHKHVVDQVTVPCAACGGTMLRVPDVLDTWFDSGSMPYAQEHYPFEGKESFGDRFPADFIAEGIDQTRAWFYYLHVMATALRDGVAFKNVVVNGIVLAEDGKKMSKRLQNYPDPMEVIEKHGSDALRLYLLSSPIVSAENLNFSERELSESTRNLFRMLWNSYSFFTTYASIDGWKPKERHNSSADILDRWILSELQVLIRDIDAAMEAYDLQKASRLFMPFVDDLSNWYIRRNRKRFWKNENDSDKDDAYATLHEVLVTLSKLMAPFTPFIAEEIYRNLTDGESVHLADFPIVKEDYIDERLNKEIQAVRKLVTIGLNLRTNAKIKVRQPLSEALVYVKDNVVREAMLNILAEELNVKKVVYTDKPDDILKLNNEYWKKGLTMRAGTLELTLNSKGLAESIVKGDSNNGPDIAINTEITPQLALEGEAREIIRVIQEGRKKAGFEVSDRITLGIIGKEKVFDGDAAEGLTGFGDEIAHETLATEVVRGDIADADYRDTTDIEGEPFTFSLKKHVK